MDFKRIEWIFFLAFLGLNIFYLEFIGKVNKRRATSLLPAKQNRLKVGWKKITSRIKDTFFRTIGRLLFKWRTNQFFCCFKNPT